LVSLCTNTKHSSSTASKIRDVETLSNGMEEPITAKWDKENGIFLYLIHKRIAHLCNSSRTVVIVKICT
ncbi:hypothetical protein AALP_AAs42669U000100, partial [Arabis alpina]